MYLSFYGLNEKPFNLTPDASFLYPSEIHREVLGHLLYGINNRKGFICVTGEVGSGKTTLCRVLLNQLDENTEVAFVLNSYLTEFELLKTINEDLGIATTGRTRKELIDELNRYLIEQNSKGKNVVVIIDEAQNLSIPVLEQLRMLSNIETEKEKLLQIVLVGQPELSKLLENEKIRQLNQRITVRHHLTPLTREELREYIYYRLNVAGSRGDVIFADGAVDEIFRFTRGIPRAINVICDQALLVGYVSNLRRITRSMVRRAVREVWGNRIAEVGGRHLKSRTVASRAAAGFIVVAFVFIGYFTAANYVKRQNVSNLLSQGNAEGTNEESIAEEHTGSLPATVNKQELKTSNEEIKSSVSEVHKEKEKTLIVKESTPETPAVLKDESLSLIMMALSSGAGSILGKELGTVTEPLADLIAESGSGIVEEPAITNESVQENNFGAFEIDATIDLLRLWNIEQKYIQAVKNSCNIINFDPDAAAKASGTGYVVFKGDFQALKNINLPAVIELKNSGDNPSYLTIKTLSDTSATILVSSKEMSMEIETLQSLMTGKIAVYCSDVFVNPSVLHKDMEISIDIRKLQDFLRILGYFKGNCSGWFTEETVSAVMKFQSDNNINPNGEVTGYMKILLFSKLPHENQIPRLLKQ